MSAPPTGRSAPNDRDRSRTTLIRSIVGTLIGFGFVGWVIADLMSGQSVTCELCLTFQGNDVCEVGSGPDEREASQSARSQACAKLASGVTESFACSSTPPRSLQCGAN